MLKLFYSRTKKATVDFSLWSLIEIVLAIGVVILLIYLSANLWGIFQKRQDYDSTINNLKELTKNVEILAKDKNKIATKTMPYGITNGYILVGFSYDDRDVIKTDCTEEEILRSRPKLCQSKSCLCIYQNFNGKDFDLKGTVSALKCNAFEQKIIFLAPRIDKQDPNLKGSESQWKPSYYSESSNYNNLVVYGICGGFWRTSWGVRKIYIEKYQDNDKIFIFIGDILNPKIIERNNYFKDKTS